MTTLFGIILLGCYFVAIIFLAKRFGAQEAPPVKPSPAKEGASGEGVILRYYPTIHRAATRRKRVIDKFNLDPESVTIQRRRVRLTDGNVHNAYAVVVKDPQFSFG
jgi:hypothetical protein